MQFQTCTQHNTFCPGLFANRQPTTFKFGSLVNEYNKYCVSGGNLILNISSTEIFQFSHQTQLSIFHSPFRKVCEDPKILQLVNSGVWALHPGGLTPHSPFLYHKHTHPCLWHSCSIQYMMNFCDHTTRTGLTQTKSSWSTPISSWLTLWAFVRRERH